MNKKTFIKKLKENFPEFKEMSNDETLQLVKVYLPKEYRDHSKNRIKELGQAWICIKEEAGRIWCNIFTRGEIHYHYHPEDNFSGDLFPVYHTVDSYDVLLERLVIDKQVGEI